MSVIRLSVVGFKILVPTTDNRQLKTDMLSRCQRLSTAEFSKAFEKGRVLRHPLLQLRVYQGEDRESQVRAAFVVPKKSGKATMRNRTRRRVREQYRLLQSEHSGPAGCDLIFVIAAAAAESSRQELEGALRELLKRAAKLVEKKSGAGNAINISRGA